MVITGKEHVVVVGHFNNMGYFKRNFIIRALDYISALFFANILYSIFFIVGSVFYGQLIEFYYFKDTDNGVGIFIP